MKKFYKGDEFLEKANRIRQEELGKLDSGKPDYGISEVEAMRKVRMSLRELLPEYMPSDPGLINDVEAHVEKEYENLAGEDGIRLSAAYVNLLNGEYDEEATPLRHRPRVDFLVSLLQKHAGALGESQETYLKSYIGRMKGAS